jgi:hypothetical protein
MVNMKQKRDIFIEKLFPSGDLLFKSGTKKMRYSGYSLKEATKKFNKFLRGK